MTDKPSKRLEAFQKLAIFSIRLELVPHARQISFGEYEGWAEGVLAFNVAESFYPAVVPFATTEEKSACFHAAVRNAPIAVIYNGIDFVKDRERVNDFAGTSGRYPEGISGGGILCSHDG